MSYYIKFNEISHEYVVVDEDGYCVWNHPDYAVCLDGASIFLGCNKEDIKDE